MRKPQSLNGAQPQNCASVFRAPFATARRTTLRLPEREWVGRRGEVEIKKQASPGWHRSMRLLTLMKLLLTAHGYGYTVRKIWEVPNGFHGHPRPPLTSVMQHLNLSSEVIRFSGDWKDSRHGDIGGFVGEPVFKDVPKRSYRRQCDVRCWARVVGALCTSPQSLWMRL